MMNRAMNLYVSRNVASLFVGELRAYSNAQKAKFILTSNTHVG
jgi:hypothetical protein